jgi:predicted nucleic-acid-binding Zn-ribbon protein
MNALNICCQKLEELERERDGWREAAYALGEAIPASWEELQPAAEQLRKFKEMVALQNEKTKNFLDIVDKHSKNVPMKKCPNCETYAKNSETKSDIIGDLWSVLDKTLYELPVGYIPAHTYESIPNMVEELVKENANMNNDWDKAMDTIEECMPQFFADAIDGSITEAVTILIKMLNDATLGEWSCLDELNEHGRYNNV